MCTALITQDTNTNTEVGISIVTDLTLYLKTHFLICLMLISLFDEFKMSFSKEHRM